MLRSLAIALALASVPALASAQGCQTIRFAPGSTSGALEGIVSPDDALCYQVEVGAGQTARVQVTGRNMMFSIPGIADGRDDFSWTTSAGSFQILVSQLMRSASDEPFTLVVSVIGG